jgi:hypothetical protein
MRSWVQAMWSPLLAVVVLFGAGSFVQTGPALVGAPSVDAAAPEQQGGAVPMCTLPRGAGDVPERSAEMRLVRDADGLFWQIQSGCRHQVTPLYMDTRSLSAIPLGEDAAFVTYGYAVPVPTPSDFELPVYARLPAEVLRVPPSQAPAASSAVVADPGTLDRYRDRVLVVDADPLRRNIIYLLQGGVRHRILLYYPLDAQLATMDPSRAGDLDSYALRGPNGFVGTISDVPWGEPAPLIGWGTGESLVVSDRTVAPDAVNCSGIGVPGTPDTGQTTLRVGATGSGRVLLVCQRFRAARPVPVDAYVANPGQYAGTDVRLTGGVACTVRYNAARDGKSFQYVAADASIPAFAYGAEAERDPALASRQVLNVGGFIQTVTEAGTQSLSGELTVFAYESVGQGPCLGQGGR